MNCLSYISAANPSALQVCRDGLINIVVQKGAVYCKEIYIQIPCGDNAGEIFSRDVKEPVAACNSAYWTIDKILQEDCPFNTVRDEEYIIYHMKCIDPNKYLRDYPLAFSFQGAVNANVGEARVQINDVSSLDGKNYENSDDLFLPFMKTTPEFYLKNFIAATDDNPNVPCTEFAKGQKISLSWESNGYYYMVYAANNPVPCYSGTATNCCIGRGAAKDTTFLLKASMTEFSTEPQDNLLEGFMPVVLTDSLTITITNAALRLFSLCVDAGVETEFLKAQKDVYADRISVSSAKVNGHLQVNGNIDVNAGGINNRYGKMDIGSLRVCDKLEAYSANVHLMSGLFQYIPLDGWAQTKTYIAQTDGILAVKYKSSPDAVTAISISKENNAFFASVSEASPNNAAETFSSIVIRKDEKFQILENVPGKGHEWGSAEFFFYPFGSGGLVECE